jgi:RNase P protein component
LLKQGERVQNGPLSVIFLQNGNKIPCLAFSITRKVGPAVVRNRIRRQLREEFHRIFKLNPEIVPPGNYLIRIKPEKWNIGKPQYLLEKALTDLQNINV